MGDQSKIQRNHPLAHRLLCEWLVVPLGLHWLERSRTQHMTDARMLVHRLFRAFLLFAFEVGRLGQSQIQRAVVAGISIVPTNLWPFLLERSQTGSHKN